jgi:integrase
MLTDIAIRKLKAKPVRYEVPDGKGGLYLVVQPSGQKGYAVRFRAGGKSRKLTLPRGLSLAEARAQAAAAILAVHRGADPTEDKRKAAQAQQAADADTFGAVAENFFHREGKKLRSARWQQRLLGRLVHPAIGHLPIATIRRKAVVGLLDKIEDENGPAMAQSTLAAVRRIMSWHSARDEDYSSPIVRGMSRVVPSEQARSRILSDDELRAIWSATAGDDPFHAFIRFLLLTAARRNEAARMTWGEVDGASWALPAARNKVKVDLVRPLSAAALAVLAARPRVDGSPYVFSYHRRPLTGFTRYKRALDIASGTADWTIHDLRRSARSLMSRAGISSDHAERCLGHAIGGVRKAYDRYEYLAEKRHAFEALAAQINLIVCPPPADNVTQLRG